MSNFNPRLFAALVLATGLAAPSIAYDPAAQSQSQPTTSNEQTTHPAYTVRTYSRMVNLDVVVEDKAGHHITGLTADDFKVEEQTPSRSGEKREQKIAAIREVQTAALKPPAALPANTALAYIRMPSARRQTQCPLRCW